MPASPYNAVTPADLDAFRSAIGGGHVLTDDEALAAWSHDYTEDLRFPPEAVLRPGSAEEIAAILKHCHERRIPVTPAGGRTGLSGGMLPVCGGVVLSTDRLDRILDIDTRNLHVTTEPGVVTQALQDAVEAKGLFYPVDPASRGSCFIGGNIAENSGGMRAVKYGITRDYVLDLEVVLPTGRIIRTGARTLKNSTGYSLTQLMVGSEGTLGIVTKATLKLRPLPGQRKLMLIPFARAEEACDAVAFIFHLGITPSALEFMEKDAIDFAQDFLDERPFDTEGVEAQLLVELDGPEGRDLMRDCERIYEGIQEKFETGAVLLAESPEEQNRLWRIRRAIGEATRAQHTVKEEDTCVPRAELAKLWRYIRDLSKAYGFRVLMFGHAGDGNLHCHILRTGQSDEEWQEGMRSPIRKIFEKTRALGGTISGEHGVGWVQKDYMDVVYGEAELELMRGIKAVFDPQQILNPGKIFPGSE